MVAPIILAVVAYWSTASAVFSIAAAMLALAGLWWFEDLWIKAGQAAPLS
jgi:hypothetical protein